MLGVDGNSNLLGGDLELECVERSLAVGDSKEMSSTVPVGKMHGREKERRGDKCGLRRPGRIFI